MFNDKAEKQVINRLATILYLMALLMLSFPAVSAAKDLKDMPRVEKMTDEEFQEISEPVVRDNEIDPAVSFEVYVPKTWQETAEDKLKNDKTNDFLYGDIANFMGPVNPLGMPSLTVHSEELSYDLYLTHWVVDKVLSQSATLSALEENPDGSVTALYVSFNPDDYTTYVTRSLFKFNGARVLSASFTVPKERYQELKDLQIKTIDSVKFTVRDPEPAEKTKKYAYLEFRTFDYPTSLVMGTADIVSSDILKLNIQLKDQQGFPKTNIDIAIISKKGDYELKNVVEDYLSRYEKNNLERRDKIEDLTFKVDEMFTLQKVEVYGMSIKRSDYKKYKEDPLSHELWLAILGDKEFYTVVSMIVPQRDANDIISWSRSFRAFETILTTMRKGQSY